MDKRIFILAFSVTVAGLNAQSLQQSSSIDFRFQFLEQHGLQKSARGSDIPATIRFKTPASSELLDHIERIGVVFASVDGTRIGTKTVYPVRLSFDHLPRLAAISEIVAVQPAWRRAQIPPLDVSRPQVQADSAWTYIDKLGRPITGKGVLIADFDTGVDFFHPMLFFADGDTLSWIDVNGDGLFDPGVDAVDLNNNGIADADETLNYVELAYAANTPGIYDANLDFLYNDANHNGIRDHGVGAGFTESSPTYGEQWFITLDTNGDNRLSGGEKLVGLKTSKIRAIMEPTGNVRRRGIDLIEANPDTGPYGGHGTSVAGIAIGGIVGVHRLAGIAPGAEMIVASIQYENAPRFFTGFASMMAWAKTEGARVMLCEDGEWVWEYLDGSSNEETMIQEMAAAGIVWVIPAGNLTGGRMQKTVYLAGHDTSIANFRGYSSVTIWPSVRWAGSSDDMILNLQVDGNPFIKLTGDGTTTTINSRSVTSYQSVSPRGTAMMSIAISPGTGGIFSLELVNTTSSPKRVEGMLGDDGLGWYGLAQWLAPTENNTVTWPATSDSSIGVAAYANKATDDGINSFSGRGTRIDGAPLVDIAAPGSTVYTIGKNTTYTPFGGTSSAGPHVAGAAALLLQADTSLTNSRVLDLLRSGASSDALTGSVPNTTWGYGRLRIVNSLKRISTSVERRLLFPLAWSLAQNYPNPFNASTVISFSVPVRSRVRLTVYNLLGQVVETLVDQDRDAGEGKVVWNARVSSGMYFCRLEAVPFGDPIRRYTNSIKLLLLR